MQTIPSKGAQVMEYIRRLQAHVNDDYASWGDRANLPSEGKIVLTLEVGRVFARIVSQNSRPNSQRSCFGFIHIMTGDIYKAASWKSPAKNFTRGNINDEFKGLSRARWQGVI